MTTPQVCELVLIDGEQVQRTRDATPEEAAEIEARRTAPAPVPQTVTRYQAKAALFAAGKLGAVQPAIDAISDPEERGLVQLEWAEKPVFERTSPTLNALGAALGLSSDQIDDLFRDAATR